VDDGSLSQEDVMSERSATESPEIVTIGPCQGCLERRVLREHACEQCRKRFGQHCGLLFQRFRTEPRLALRFWAVLPSGKKAVFERIFGDPRTNAFEVVRIAEQDVANTQSTPLAQGNGMGDLEKHVCAVLLSRKSSHDDLLRAAGMVRVLWPEMTPERWTVLLGAVRLHHWPRFLRCIVRSMDAVEVRDLGGEQLAADLRMAVDQARLARLPERVAVLLRVAARVGVAPRMEADHLQWALPRVPESVECLTRWVWEHADDTSFVGIADRVARFDELRQSFGPRRGVAWVALWQRSSRERWSSYASSFAEMHKPDPQSDPGHVQERLAAWVALVEEVVWDGPARAVVERRPNGRASLRAASFSEPDPFVRALLVSWVNRDHRGTWMEEADADNGW
jgi:hypothetical protein